AARAATAADAAPLAGMEPEWMREGESAESDPVAVGTAAGPADEPAADPVDGGEPEDALRGSADDGGLPWIEADADGGEEPEDRGADEAEAEHPEQGDAADDADERPDPNGPEAGGHEVPPVDLLSPPERIDRE